MTDPRRSYRKKTFLAAYVDTASAEGSVPCLVRDLSRHGARIMIVRTASLPKTFDLHINGRDQILRVETLWRNATELGVRLIDKIPLAVPPEARRA